MFASGPLALLHFHSSPLSAARRGTFQTMLRLLFLSLALGISAKDAKEAERLVKQSIVEYNVGDFDAALADVTKAYKLRPAPALLFNIGQCHRALHHWEKAEFFYHGYLREKPDAPNRDKVEALIEEMQQKQRAEGVPAAVTAAAPLAAAPLAAPLATPTPPPVEATTVPLVMTEPRATPAPANAAPAAATEATMPAARRESSHPSGWAIGLGSGAIAATVVAGIGAATLIDFQSYRNGLQGPPQTYPGSTYLSKRSQAQAWQVITPIAAGVAATCLLGAVLTW